MKWKPFLAFFALCAALLSSASASAAIPDAPAFTGVSSAIYAVRPYDPLNQIDTKYLCDSYDVSYIESDEPAVNYDIMISASGLRAYAQTEDAAPRHWVNLAVVPDSEANMTAQMKFSGLFEDLSSVTSLLWDFMPASDLQLIPSREEWGFVVSFPADAGAFPRDGAWYFGFQWLDENGVPVSGDSPVICRVRLSSNFFLAPDERIVPLSLHDFREENPVPDQELYDSYDVQSSAVYDMSRGCYTQVNIHADNVAAYQFLPKHFEGADASVGHWVGFSAYAPQNAAHFSSSVAAGTGRNCVGFESYGSLASEYYIYFGFDVSDPKNRETEVSILWYDEDYQCMGVSYYRVQIDASAAPEPVPEPEPEPSPVVEPVLEPETQPEPEPEPLFLDVKEDDWYYDAIAYVTENNIMPGASETLFAPNANATRSTVVSILYNLAGSPAVSKIAEYSDVPQNASYAKAVTWAAEKGIAGGYGDGTFGPNDSITREQLAVLLYRYEQLQGGILPKDWNYRPNYKDTEKISAWAYEAVCWYTKNGILAGTDGVLGPQNTTTRAQMAVILQRFCEGGTSG